MGTSLQDPALLKALGTFHILAGKGKTLAELRVRAPGRQILLGAGLPCPNVPCSDRSSRGCAREPKLAH